MSVWTIEHAVKVYGPEKRDWLLDTLAPHLRRYEIACRCGCGNAEMSTAFLYLWTAIRLRWGKSIWVTSGCRCLEHNRAVYRDQGLAPNDKTKHLAEVAKGILGRAGDITPSDPREYQTFARFLDPIVGDGGFGIYPGRLFCHVDTGESEDLRTRRRSRWEG